jgi:hypothetical protein
MFPYFIVLFIDNCKKNMFIFYFLWGLYRIIVGHIMKKSLNSDSQQFHQYQQNK